MNYWLFGLIFAVLAGIYWYIRIYSSESVEEAKPIKKRIKRIPMIFHYHNNGNVIDNTSVMTKLPPKPITIESYHELVDAAKTFAKTVNCSLTDPEKFTIEFTDKYSEELTGFDQFKQEWNPADQEVDSIIAHLNVDKDEDFKTQSQNLNELLGIDPDVPMAGSGKVADVSKDRTIKINTYYVENTDKELKKIDTEPQHEITVTVKAWFGHKHYESLFKAVQDKIGELGADTETRTHHHDAWVIPSGQTVTGFTGLRKAVID